MDATVTSMRAPGLRNAEMSAVIMTAAEFLALICVGSTVSPLR